MNCSKDKQQKYLIIQEILNVHQWQIKVPIPIVYSILADLQIPEEQRNEAYQRLINEAMQQKVYVL